MSNHSCINLLISSSFNLNYHQVFSWKCNHLLYQESEFWLFPLNPNKRGGAGTDEATRTVSRLAFPSRSVQSSCVGFLGAQHRGLPWGSGVVGGLSLPTLQEGWGRCSVWPSRTAHSALCAMRVTLQSSLGPFLSC